LGAERSEVRGHLPTPKGKEGEADREKNARTLEEILGTRGGIPSKMSIKHEGKAKTHHKIFRMRKQ